MDASNSPLTTGIRAALAWIVRTASLAREHNDANVVAIGAREHSPEEALEIATVFAATSFSGDPRHTRRIAQIRQIETAVR